MNANRTLTVRAVAGDGEDAREIVFRGQQGKALLALAAAGARGVTALECAGWAYRLAAYAHSLRKRCGLVIETVREGHPGGWHGRHVLRSRVEIVSVDGADHE